MAPEVILSGEVDHQEYDARADVWSYLTTMMTMMMNYQDDDEDF